MAKTRESIAQYLGQSICSLGRDCRGVRHGCSGEHGMIYGVSKVHGSLYHALVIMARGIDHFFELRGKAERREFGDEEEGVVLDCFELSVGSVCILSPVLSFWACPALKLGAARERWRCSKPQTAWSQS